MQPKCALFSGSEQQCPVKIAQFSSWRHCQMWPTIGGMSSYKAKHVTTFHT